jgi:4-amino-4-deoxy-L-arabinose transferase-like glycosyltransferase
MRQGSHNRLRFADVGWYVRGAIGWVQHLPENPGTLIAVCAGLQVVVWTLSPALMNWAPPLDVVESAMWGREWVLATHKHPALPSWVLEAAHVLAGGRVGWPTYLAPQLFVAATFACVFLLGRDLMDASRAAAGTLLLTGVGTYAWLTPEFNHNIAQLPFWAGVALALWRAVERQSVLWWTLVGLLAASGVYAKLTTGVLLTTLAAWTLLDAKARRSLVTPGPWLALAIFLALVAPLMVWLVHHDFQPLAYAAERSQQNKSGSVLMFALSTFGNIAGLLIMLPLAALVGGWSGDQRSSAASPGHVGPRALRYLIFLAVGPLLLAVVAALVSRSGLRAAWASPMFNFLGLLAVALASPGFRTRTLARIAACAGGLLLLAPVGYALAVELDVHKAGKTMRVNWPQAEIARRFAAIWDRETGRPLRIVAGDPWVAGLVGITAKDNPSLFDSGNQTISPWITRERVGREGMLVVWQNTKRPPHRIAEFMEGRPVGEERFRNARSGKDFVIRYVVVPPTFDVD